jgi:hypothetical protein
LWDAAYFRWQLPAEDRQLAVAAYDGDKLVGCFFSLPHALHMGGEVVPMTLSSWCTVDPAYRSGRLALALVEALRRRHEETGQAFSIGFVSGDKTSIAHRFWSLYARLAPQTFSFIGHFGFWAKILDPPRLARAAVGRDERALVRLLGPLSKITPWRWPGGLRPCDAGDLDACLALLECASADLDWSLAWSREQLARQLIGAVPRTLVLDHGGKVQGLANFHRLGLKGREIVHGAMLDLWATHGLSASERIRFLGAVCGGLRDQGVQFVQCLRSPMFPADVLLANGFIPLPARDCVVAFFPRQALPTLPKTWALLMR